MAEVLIEFSAPVRSASGHEFAARVCGRQRADRLWEGWIEFTSLEGRAPVRSGRETTQPNHADLLYWATGLTAAYLQGALARVLPPTLPSLRPRIVNSQPWFDGPAPSSPRSDAPEPEAILDPFAVYAAGNTILRGQLNALSDGQLRGIIRAHRLSAASPAELDITPRPQLIEQIMRAVEELAV